MDWYQSLWFVFSISSDRFHLICGGRDGYSWEGSSDWSSRLARATPSWDNRKCKASSECLLEHTSSFLLEAVSVANLLVGTFCQPGHHNTSAVGRQDRMLWAGALSMLDLCQTCLRRKDQSLARATGCPYLRHEALLLLKDHQIFPWVYLLSHLSA